jgi:hypothetical protein
MAQSALTPQIKDDVLQFLHHQSVDGRIQAMILDLVNQALRVQSIVLSNQQMYALTRDITKDILEKMLKEYGN